MQRLLLYSGADLDKIEHGAQVVYIGLGLVAIGLLTMVVGLEEKGFQTVGMRMIGPSLLTGGCLLVAFRVIMCFVARKKGGGGGTLKLSRDANTEEIN